MTTLARAERQALAQLLRDLGPEGDTLCAGWRNHEMAAHLVSRDRNLLAGPGLLIPKLHPLTERVERRTGRRPYDLLVDQVEAGPRLPLPARVDEAINLGEYFVHHEDVRRPADPAPRRLSRELDAALWKRVRGMAKVMTLRVRELELRLETDDGRSATVGRGRPQRATVRGDVGELVLWLFGRRSVARVEVSGSGAALTGKVGL